MTVSTQHEESPSCVYHVIRETTDILFDYGDSEVRGTYKTLQEANEAAVEDLSREYKMSELEEYSEIRNKDGAVHINAGTGEVDFIVKVVCQSLQSSLKNTERDVYLVNRMETTLVKTASGIMKEKVSRTTGVFRHEDGANEAAERELRKAAGITSWRDRRRFKGVFREEYDLDGLFEGAVTIKPTQAGGCEREIIVVVERRILG